MCTHIIAIEISLVPQEGETGVCDSEEGEQEEEEQEEEGGELDPPKVLGDVLESLAGAVFLDSGMSLEAVWSVFQPLFEEKISECDTKGASGPFGVPFPKVSFFAEITSFSFGRQPWTIDLVRHFDQYLYVPITFHWKVLQS